MSLSATNSLAGMARRGGPLARVLVAAVGVGAWTLTEYVAHRWVMHGSRRWGPVSREHRIHHADPEATDPRLRALGYAAVITPAVAGAAAAGAWPLGVGWAAGYAAYEQFHWREHHRPPLGPWERDARRRHFAHHFGAPRRQLRGHHRPLGPRLRHVPPARDRAGAGATGHAVAAGRATARCALASPTTTCSSAPDTRARRRRRTLGRPALPGSRDRHPATAGARAPEPTMAAHDRPHDRDRHRAPEGRGARWRGHPHHEPPRAAQCAVGRDAGRAAGCAGGVRDGAGCPLRGAHRGGRRLLRRRRRQGLRRGERQWRRPRDRPVIRRDRPRPAPRPAGDLRRALPHAQADDRRAAAVRRRAPGCPWRWPATCGWRWRARCSPPPSPRSASPATSAAPGSSPASWARGRRRSCTSCPSASTWARPPRSASSTRSIPPTTFEDAWRALAAQLAGGPTIAYRYIKDNINRAVERRADRVHGPGGHYHQHCGRTEDHLEASKAFVEKRVPDLPRTLSCVRSRRTQPDQREWPKR